jgi:hypothetical protein
MADENQTQGQGDAGSFDPAEKITQEAAAIEAHVKRAIEHLVTYGESKIAETVKFLHAEYVKHIGK